MLDQDSLGILRAALERLDSGFAALPELPAGGTDRAALERVLMDVAGRLHDNYPYFHRSTPGRC